MSRPRTRSQGPPEMEGSEEDQPTTTQRRMLRELQVRLEALKLLPTRLSEGGEPAQLQQETSSKTVRPASVTLRPLSTIPPASRLNSVMGFQSTKEVSTIFNKYHMVPMHNSTAEDGKQNHTMGLTLPRPEDIDNTDLEGTLANKDASEDRLLFPATNGQGTTGDLHDMTLPSANTFRMIKSGDKWLKRYLPDSHNSQIGNVIDKEEVTTNDGEQWYKIKIPYLRRFYSTGSYLIGKKNDYICDLKSDEDRDGICEDHVDTI